MVKERADWCISRQRKWGVPIPVVYCQDCGKEIIDNDIMMKVSKIFGEEGSDAWFAHDTEYFLPEGFKCPHCGSAKGFDKERILWMFGSIQVLPTLQFAQGENTSRFLLTYILRVLTNTEVGSNHHFLLLLQAATALRISKLLLTAGLLTAKAKMSKSLGNGIAPQEIIRNTAQIFFVFGLQVPIIMQIFVSALKF